MNRLSVKHKKILNDLASVYNAEDKKGTSKYYSKKQLRYILICFKWNINDAINCIEKEQCYYWFADD